MDYHKGCWALSKNKPLTTREANLIRIIRTTRYGEIKIIIQEGQPVRVEEIKKSIKL
ncbi:MAG: YezD family protein [Peptococcaceae bacterium]|nr:YezD family protein [Peptococcaceae bacterium]